jgi:membrane fusion protein (multidrug efflux system)
MEEKTSTPETSETLKPAPPPPPPRNRKRRLQIFGVIAAVVLAVLVIFYYVLFVAPYESTDDAFIDGYVTLIAPRVSGPVTQLLITDNQQVKAGDELVEIDPRDYEASLSQAKADFAAAQSQLDSAQAQVSVSQSKVTQAQAAVIAAEAQDQRASADLKRYESVESRAVSKTDYDLAQAQARSASANLDAANSQVKAAEAQVTLDQAGIETANAAVQQAQAKLQQAELNLSYTKITAPFDGRITARTVQNGNYVSPGQALFALVPKDIWVTANFKETQLKHMQVGQKADIHVDSSGRTLHGHVDSIAGATGPLFSLLPPENATGNYVKIVQRVPVKIVLEPGENRDRRLRPGMNVVPDVYLR